MRPMKADRHGKGSGVLEDGQAFGTGYFLGDAAQEKAGPKGIAAKGFLSFAGSVYGFRMGEIRVMCRHEFIP